MYVDPHYCSRVYSVYSNVAVQSVYPSVLLPVVSVHNDIFLIGHTIAAGNVVSHNSDIIHEHGLYLNKFGLLNAAYRSRYGHSIASLRLVKCQYNTRSIRTSRRLAPVEHGIIRLHGVVSMCQCSCYSCEKFPSLYPSLRNLVALCDMYNNNSI